MLKLYSLVALFYTVNALPRPSSKTCYEGYTLSRNNICVREIDETPQPACQAGDLDGKGCRVQIPKITRCNEGYTMDSQTKTCSYILPSEFQYFCPPGFTDNGDDCILSTPGPITEYCEDSERVGDKCIKFLRADKIVTVDCPEGSVKDEEDKCWKVAETFDCSENLPKIAALLDNNKKKHRTLAGNEGFTPATPPKQFRTVVVTQGCEKRFEVPAVVTQYCPENFVSDSKGCFLEEAVPLKTKCIATGGSVLECPPVIRRTPKVARCPDGLIGTRGKCLEIVKGDTIQYCPPDFEDKGDMCEKFIEVSLKCPADLLFKNGRCLGRKTHAPVILSDTQVGNLSSTTSTPLKIPFKEPRAMKPFK